MESLAQILPLVLLVGVFWLLVIRPARKRAQEMASVQADVEPGRRVMLASGLFGEVRRVADDVVNLEIAEGVVVEVARQAVVRVEDPAPESGAGDTAREGDLTSSLSPADRPARDDDPTHD